jgi:hypothetical protein
MFWRLAGVLLAGERLRRERVLSGVSSVFLTLTALN